MTGLDKIMEQIEADSSAVCAKILETAEKQAAQTTAAGEAAAEQAYQQILENAQRKNALELQKAKSGAAALKNRRILAAKSQLIHEVITEAQNRLNALSGEEYYRALAVLLQKNKTGAPGEVLLSKKDLEQMPADFLAPFPELTPVAAEISGGFILRYGGVEQNCTFDALLDSALEEIKDQLAPMLFA